jgi:hypothetical protein
MIIILEWDSASERSLTDLSGPSLSFLRHHRRSWIRTIVRLSASDDCRTSDGLALVSGFAKSTIVGYTFRNSEKLRRSTVTGTCIFGVLPFFFFGRWSRARFWAVGERRVGDGVLW